MPSDHVKAIIVQVDFDVSFADAKAAVAADSLLTLAVKSGAWTTALKASDASLEAIEVLSSSADIVTPSEDSRSDDSTGLVVGLVVGLVAFAAIAGFAFRVRVFSYILIHNVFYYLLLISCALRFLFE